MGDIKVASILDNRRLVLNSGSNTGIKLGDRYRIFAAKGKEIIDPDSKKVLGTYEIEKLPVEVIEVQKEFSIAETYRYSEVNEGGNFDNFAVVSNYLTPKKIVRKYDTFDIDLNTRKEIDEAKSVIKIGDIARKMEPSSDQ